MKNHILLFVQTSAVLVAVLAVVNDSLSAPPSLVEDEYYRRIAALLPRDAGACYALGSWCAENGLDDQARQLYERTVRIDSDHGEARLALGYRRYGLRWIVGARPSRTRRSRSKEAEFRDRIPASEVTGKPERARVSPPTVSPPKSPTPPRPQSPPQTPTKRGSKRPGATSGTELALEAKRDFGKKAEEKTGDEYHTREDSNFVIHTTHSLNSPAFRELTTELKAITKTIRTTLGLTSRGSPWPKKIQLFQLQSTTEYSNFADLVDNLGFAPREGSYISERGHVVFHRLDSAFVGRHLAQEAVGHFGGSADVGWWLRLGAGELIAAQTAKGREQRLYEHAVDLVSAMLEADEAAFHVKDLLESKGPGRNLSESTAQALTLVDFLSRTGRSRLGKLLSQLASAEAPRLSGTGDETSQESNDKEDDGNDSGDEDASVRDASDFRRFFVEYIVFQEEAIASVFRMDVTELDKKWKRFVLTRAKSARQRLKGNSGR